MKGGNPHMLNKVLLIGYAGADSEMKLTTAGIPVANFSLAVKEVYKNGDGEKKTNTLWIRCVAWRRWGEIAGEFITRGKFLSKAFDKKTFIISNYLSKGTYRRYRISKGEGANCFR
jgi:hypothetical protein